MSYQESNGIVTLTMSRKDFEQVLLAIGIALGCASRDGLPIQYWLELANRINEGNPNFVPYPEEVRRKVDPIQIETLRKNLCPTGEPQLELSDEMPDWLQHTIHSLLIATTTELSPKQVAQAIHDALLIANAEKYATPNTRFSFAVSNATQEDIAEIRRHLSEFENSIVELFPR